ncbi:methyltransferase domain-containing protein [Saccharopolyspora pogona]|uniref:methyltransferase domain-containing protein n=1 Tax=Saccharopolyspora pogona TaxID=333966 RepID=UPI001684B77D|nr:methyltransferase domain-containing protein [Saccharopolyspora pogona]
MTTLDDTTALRNGLTEQLSAGVLTTPMWREAFRTVPRHLFAPQFALHTPGSGTFVYHDTTAPDTERRASALAAAYTDDTLITQFDDAGVPVSSSTEPSLMASMLEELDARRGHQVLEIGTGTGYNAALLCAALGEDNVTTIDVAAELVAAARPSLTAAGYRPVVVSGNGAAGVPERAPFDRIIATCAVSRIPAAWLEQLAPEGAILVNISKGLVLLRRTDDGDAVSGRFLSPAGFMPLRSAGEPSGPQGRQIVDATSGEADSTHREQVPWDVDFAMAAFFADLVADRSRLVFTHDENGAVTSYRWLHPGTGSWARVEATGDGQGVVHQAGQRRLWTELTPILESWFDDHGRPGIQRYGLTVSADGRHQLWLDTPGMSEIVIADATP